jgi:hypothetical protein
MAFATNSTNTANLNFTFPMKGTFSGAFLIIDTTGFGDQVSGTGNTGINFKSALLPAATITGGIGQTTGNSPGLGSVVVTNSTAHIMLTGALPNHTFNTAMCGVATQFPCTTLFQYHHQRAGQRQRRRRLGSAGRRDHLPRERRKRRAVCYGIPGAVA